MMKLYVMDEEDKMSAVSTEHKTNYLFKQTCNSLISKCCMLFNMYFMHKIACYSNAYEITPVSVTGRVCKPQKKKEKKKKLG